MKIGYARVSTKEQNPDLQYDALTKDGCEKVFCDYVSGAKNERPEYSKSLKFLRRGDMLVVWKLDRLGRSLPDLISKVKYLKENGIEFKSIQDNIDTSTPGGRLVFHIMGSLAEFERDLIRERTNAGLAASRSRGKIGGRPKSLDNSQIGMLKALHADKTNDVKKIMETMGVGKTTLYKYVKG